MKNKYLLLIILIMLITYKVIPDNISIEKQEVIDNIKIFNMDLEDYIIGVVAAEMPASFDEEALKAQAIAARTYAIYKIHNNQELTKDESTQSYIDKDQMIEKWGDEFYLYYEKIKNAVYETKSLVITNDNEVISAFYFAISNGYTSDSMQVFNQNLDYIEPKESLWDINVSKYMQTIEISKDDFCEKLNIHCDTIDIESIDRNENNQIINIKINEKNFSGIEFRKILDLRSTDIEIEIEDTIYITTKGYGHGVGLSQYGANEMAKLGYNYEEILKHYYTNIEINKLSE